MRKIILTCLFAVFALNGFAQLTNLDFENWYADSAGGQKLVNWMHYTRNTLITQGHQVGTWQDTDRYSGNYSLMLSRWYGSAYDHVIQGAATTLKTQGITGYYKYEDASLYSTSTGGPFVIDSANITVAVTKWNAVTASRDTIGLGHTLLPGMTNFTPFSVAVNYTSSAVPDSIFLHICPTIYTQSNLPWCPGGGYCSYLTVDDISVLPVAVATLKLGNSLTVSPNPVSNVLRIVLDNKSISALLCIEDMAGRIVVTPMHINGSAELDLSALSPGAYVVIVTDDKEVQHYKIIKQ
ncbi:MAG: T9SS type A sorting domain-containing protein [Flavipsychrobacter sp.]|nr:T9SS type A sorting domain-containing protein [Flavipsychrobacter sp.]